MWLSFLTTQNLIHPIGLEQKNPRLSYRLDQVRQGDRQTALQVLAASSLSLLEEGKADLWDSGKLETAEQAVRYAGSPLTSRQRVFWKARVWDAQGQPSLWSLPAAFELGLLQEEDWKGCWIGRGDDFSGDKSRSPVLAGEFTVVDPLQAERARLYISGLGLFTACLNGQPVTDALFEPGESEFEHRVYYSVYDVTSLLREGRNVLTVQLGNGQYANFAVDPVMRLAGDVRVEKGRYQKYDTIYLRDGICGDVKLLAQLELTAKDGTVEPVLSTGEDWRWQEGPVTFQNWYGGEDYDARVAASLGLSDPVSSDFSSWPHAVKMQPPKGRLSAKDFPPVKISEIWTAKSVRRLPNGRWLVDMGKNSAGFVLLRLFHTEKYPGRRIDLYPAEVLRADGTGVDQASCTQSCDTLFDCVVKDSYVTAGTGTEEWHPSFCYHGFQYVEVDGFPGEPSAENFIGCAVRTQNQKVSDFETDNRYLNRINEITDRSIESNMMFSFTDCPQIEKLGWLETTHLMFSSMAGGYDIRPWIPKLVRDMADAQVTEETLREKPMDRDPRRYPGFDFERFANTETEDEGFVPAIAPEYFRIGALYRDPNWGGACIMTPWYYYREYGDDTLIREHYGMMKAYLRHLGRHAPGGVLKDYAQMGEWGQLREETPATLVATCSYYLLTCTMVSIAELLEQQEDAQAFRALSDGIRDGFYSDPECCTAQSGVCGNGSQASYGCALFSGILRPEDRPRAVEKLLAAVEVKNGHLTSGEVGLKQVFQALAAAGRNDVVYRMVMNPTEPSYRNHIDQGLTTLPEFWNYTELWNGLGRSRNHAMMGHVKEWLIRSILGVSPVEPGYRKLLIRPDLCGTLNRVRGSILTPYGYVRVDCRVDKQTVSLRTEIPAGTEGEIWIPRRPGQVCLLDGTPAEISCSVEEKDGWFRVAGIPSGVYEWKVCAPEQASAS